MPNGEGAAIDTSGKGVGGATEDEIVRRIDAFFWTGRLVPLFPIGRFTPGSQCPHHGPIRDGSVLCCMVCHQSGMDAHPALKVDRRFMPRPRPEPKPEPEPDKRTRRQKRKAKYDAG